MHRKSHHNRPQSWSERLHESFLLHKILVVVLSKWLHLTYMKMRWSSLHRQRKDPNAAARGYSKIVRIGSGLTKVQNTQRTPSCIALYARDKGAVNRWLQCCGRKTCSAAVASSCSRAQMVFQTGMCENDDRSLEA
jgi:hypothetical protein